MHDRKYVNMYIGGFFSDVIRVVFPSILAIFQII